MISVAAWSTARARSAAGPTAAMMLSRTSTDACERTSGRSALVTSVAILSSRICGIGAPPSAYITSRTPGIVMKPGSLWMRCDQPRSRGNSSMPMPKSLASATAGKQAMSAAVGQSAARKALPPNDRAQVGHRACEKRCVQWQRRRLRRARPRTWIAAALPLRHATVQPRRRAIRRSPRAARRP